jgi:transcriptional regulator with XRE-family HTH domain
MTMTEEMTPAYARHVGERLRNIRRQQGLSLQAVEEQSGREFKASVLGAYERGERIISVLRLQRLAHLYGVPVDQLLPRIGDGQSPRGQARSR